jgi:hypothetical protein
MLGHRAKDVDRQLIGVRHVYRNEVRSGFHQVRDEGHVPGKSIELGNYQGGLVLLRREAMVPRQRFIVWTTMVGEASLPMVRGRSPNS